MTSFVGRQAELSALQALVDDGAKVVTLVGRSGIGKSRLALELLDRVGARVEVGTGLGPRRVSDEVIFEVPMLSDADGAALYVERSGGGVSSARALDGLPLTVELLAARGSAHSSDVRGAFDATHALLTRPERELLAALVNLPGFVTLERAEQLSPDALELLESLRDAALVQVVDVGEGKLHFALHDAIRALVRVTRT